MLGLGKPGERLEAEILEIEQRADLPPCALCNDECARLGHCLQPGGKVRRLADDPALLRGTGADQVANHDKAAGDTKPHIQPFRRREPADRVDDGEPGPQRPLGIVLMRLRIAEILGDKTGVPGDRIGDATLIGADHLAQILGIVARRQCRRADQIAEHHRQLAPLGLAGDRC